MRHHVIGDSIGVAILAGITALPLGCITRPPAPQKVDLQPFIAVAGNYSLMVSGPRPTPAPAPSPAPGPAGCAAGCKCRGTGKEPTGDGLSIVPCRCEQGCQGCKTPTSR
jgi:hypothetical protein